MPKDDAREILMPLSDANDLDEVVHELSIEASDTTPAEAVRELKAEIERLRSELSALRGEVELEPGQLRPCPFCAGEAIRHELDDKANFGGSVIECTRCGASSPVHFDRKENLDSSWNDRAAPVPPAPDRLRKALEEAKRLVDLLRAEASRQSQMPAGVVFSLTDPIMDVLARAALAEGGVAENMPND